MGLWPRHDFWSRRQYLFRLTRHRRRIRCRSRQRSRSGRTCSCRRRRAASRSTAQDTSDDEPDDEPSLSRTRVLKAPSNVKPLKSLDDTVSMLFSAEALPENDGQAAPQYLIPSLVTRRIAPFRRYSINIPTVHHAFADHPKVSKPIQSEIPSLGYPCRNVPLILCNVCAFSVWSNQVGPGDYCSALECF